MTRAALTLCTLALCGCSSHDQGYVVGFFSGAAVGAAIVALLFAGWWHQ